MTMNSLFLLGLLLCSLLSLASVLLVGLVLSDLSVNHGGILLDLGPLDGLLDSDLGHDDTGLLGGGGLELLGSGVVDFSLLVNTFSSWEKNQLGLVFIKSCNIPLLLLHVFGLSSMINCNSNGLGEFGRDGCSLELLMGESSSVSNLGIVLSGASLDERSQLLQWSWENRGCFLGSSSSSDFLVSNLVKIDPDSSLPVLSQVRTSEHVVVLDHVAY